MSVRHYAENGTECKIGDSDGFFLAETSSWIFIILTFKKPTYEIIQSHGKKGGGHLIQNGTHSHFSQQGSWIRTAFSVNLQR